MHIDGHEINPSSFLAGKCPNGIDLLLSSRQKQNALEFLAILKILRQRGIDVFSVPELIIRSLNANSFHYVWSSPSAFFWTRIAYGFVHKSNSDNVPARFAQWIGIEYTFLLEHLANRLWLLAIAGLIFERRNYTMTETLKLPARGSLPTMSIAWVATNQFWITGTERGCLLITDECGNNFIVDGNQSVNGLQILQKPSLLDNETGLYLDIWSEYTCANFRGLEQTTRISDYDELVTQSLVFKQALNEILCTMPELHSEICKLLRTATPLKPVGSGLPSSSNSSITGAIWYTTTTSPELLGEMIIHEYTHNKLFLLQDIDPLIDPKVHGTAWESCMFYSPWRDDPRPLNGIFHGYVVFAEAAEFWFCRLMVCNNNTISLRRFGMLVRQLQAARSVLEKHCTFTPVGTVIMKSLADRIDHKFNPLAESLDTDTLPIFHMESNNDFSIDAGSSIGDALRSHRRQWDTKNPQFL